MTTVTILDWPVHLGGPTAPPLDLAVVGRAIGTDLGTVVATGLDDTGRITLSAAVTHDRLVAVARFFLEPHGVGVVT